MASLQSPLLTTCSLMTHGWVLTEDVLETPSKMPESHNRSQVRWSQRVYHNKEQSSSTTHRILNIIQLSHIQVFKCHEIHRNACSRCLCLQLHFSLYLYGEFNGTVLLSLEDNSTVASPLVWERSGQWKDNWQDITLQLPALLNGYSAFIYC